MKQLDELTIFQFPQMVKENCGMFIVEDLSELDHEVQRIFIVSPDSQSTRGDHAHLDCWQTLVCIRGIIDVVVDDGIQKKKFTIVCPCTMLMLGYCHFMLFYYRVIVKYKPNDLVHLYFGNI